MMEGIDSTFNGVFFIGYHSGAHQMKGVRAHTMSSAMFAEVRLNGMQCTESTINAAIAGHFNVPILLISGDNIAVSEAQQTLGKEVNGVIVKTAIGFHAAAVKLPRVAASMIEEGVALVIQPEYVKANPFIIKSPIELEIRFKNYRIAEILSYLPCVTRVDSRIIKFIGKDIIEISKFLVFVVNYDPHASP